MDLKRFKASTIKDSLSEKLTEISRLRQQGEQDISLTELARENFNMSVPDLVADLGIELDRDTVNNIVTHADYQSIRWVVPEIFREALALGLRKSPIWPNITATEQSIKGLSIISPYVNMSDASPEKVNEAETIPLGSISVGQKAVSIFKIGKGIKMSYEVRNYVSLNVLSIFFRDFGVKMGYAMDSLAINTLINGDQPDGSESAAVIGITTPGTFAYKDLLRIWIRASRMGRNFNTIVGGEAAALITLDLPEFKNRATGTTEANLRLRTPVPNTADYFIHGNIPANQQLLIDPSAALIKYNAQPLLIESEKIVSNQTEAAYATLTTGFSKAFRDASLLVDSSLSISTAGFPAYMDVDGQLNELIA
jgi:hypothetical protein